MTNDNKIRMTLLGSLSDLVGRMADGDARLDIAAVPVCSFHHLAQRELVVFPRVFLAHYASLRCSRFSGLNHGQNFQPRVECVAKA
jgi:hypothetical protein